MRCFQLDAIDALHLARSIADCITMIDFNESFFYWGASRL